MIPATLDLASFRKQYEKFVDTGRQPIGTVAAPRHSANFAFALFAPLREESLDPAL